MEGGQQQQTSELQYVTSNILKAIDAYHVNDEIWREKEAAQQKMSDAAAVKRHEEEKSREEVKIWIKKTSQCDGSTVSAMREWLMDIDLVHENFGDSRVIQTLDVATTVATSSLRREILRIMKETPGIKWREVREKLQNRFLSINENEALRQNLEKLKQSQTESVANFCRIFRDAAEQAYPPLSRNEDQQRLILRYFLQGLKSNELAKRLNNEGRPNTIEEALKLVAQYEEDADRYRRLERIEEPMEIGSANKNRDDLQRIIEKLNTKIAELEIQVNRAKTTSEWPGMKYDRPQNMCQRCSYENSGQGNNHSHTYENAYGRGDGQHNGRGLGRRPGMQNRPSPRWIKGKRPICVLCNQAGHLKYDGKRSQSRQGKHPVRRK